MVDERQTYRSVGATMLNDNLSFGINIRFLARLCIGASLLGYYGMHLLDRLESVEENLLEINSEIRGILDKQMVLEQEKRQQLEDRIKFYEREYKIDLNPLNMFNKKRK